MRLLRNAHPLASATTEVIDPSPGLGHQSHPVKRIEGKREFGPWRWQQAAEQRPPTDRADWLGNRASRLNRPPASPSYGFPLLEP